jgi:hypothetical protein
VPGADGPLDRIFSGGIVAIAGGPELPSVIDLAAPTVPLVWIQAPDNFDFSAYWAASGDFDGDGFIDIMPNGMAGDGPDNRRDNAGEVHVVSGRLVAQMLGGAVQETVTAEASAALPAQAVLEQNFPNPFNAVTAIGYSLPKAAVVEIAIYNTLGQRVVTLVDGWRRAGDHAVYWDGRGATGAALASGVYFYRLTTRDRAMVRALVLLQ